MIMAIASLRVIRPSIPSDRLASLYRKTYISRYYPDVEHIEEHGSASSPKRSARMDQSVSPSIRSAPTL